MTHPFCRAGTAMLMLLAIVFTNSSLQAQEEEEAAESDSTSAQTLKVGDKAPDFEVESFNNKTIKLSDRFGDSGHPVILLFSRANW